MAKDLKGKYFVASRGVYGTNFVSYKGIEIDATKFNQDYTGSITNFNWGDTDKASNLLAYAILHTVATPTVARVYSNKYTQNIIKNLHQDEWRIEAIEVAKWINENTNYKIELDDNDEREAQKQEEERRRQEEIEKEKRRIKREEEFKKQVQAKLVKHAEKSEQMPEKQKEEREIKEEITTQPMRTNNIVDKLCQELNIRNETLAKILGIPMDTVNNWRLENEMPKLAIKAIEFYKAGIEFKEKNSKLKTDIEQLEEQLKEKLVKNQTEYELLERKIKQYEKFISEIDIPSLYAKYKEL